MSDFIKFFDSVYKQGKLFGVDKKLTKNPLLDKKFRSRSVAIAGGVFGDEGKGRITDELTAQFLKKNSQVIHYRDNGGANAGHTVEVGSIKLALHQLGSAVTQPGCVIVLGKEMVLHPEDLVIEINDVLQATGQKKLPAQLKIDELAFLCLDTHRAFEAVLKSRSTGSMGATGRGISPAYADVIYRHPLRMRDLMARDWQNRVKKHYQLYQAWVAGFEFKLSQIEVPRLDGQVIKVGSLSKMLARLEVVRKVIKPFVESVHNLMSDSWQSQVPMVFEKAQAIGLDKRWGVYPDVTASNCCFDGLFSSTSGVVDHTQIAVKAATIKATYSSSVGQRLLPTMMKGRLAERIRSDANEYGATTKRPRDIAYFDLPMISYFMKVGGVDFLAITHLDISYSEVPIKVCVGYEVNKKSVEYQPDQDFLDKVKPKYIELPAWDGAAAAKARSLSQLPMEALQYVAFICQSLGVKPLIGTVGPKRDQTIFWY